MGGRADYEERRKARQETYRRLAQKAEGKSRQYMNSNANRILEMTPRSANNYWISSLDSTSLNAILSYLYRRSKI